MIDRSRVIYSRSGAFEAERGVEHDGTDDGEDGGTVGNLDLLAPVMRVARSVRAGLDR